MTAKMRNFHFTCYTHRRGHGDDAEVPPGQHVEPDAWMELRGAILFPADPNWWDGETEEPDWDHGAYLAEARSGRVIPGTNMAGRPMETMIEAWRSGRRIVDGVLIFSAGIEAKKERR